MEKMKETTTTILVEEQLRSCDDFMSNAMLVTATGRDANHISAALHHLRKYLAADVIIAPDGVGWWYATPYSDTRIKKVIERTPESRPRRTRKKRN